jgi:phosphatidylserine/phosphatidylglycerophosphate/cardiolipin synthase-like enzyme
MTAPPMVRLDSHNTLYPWREGNRFRLLIDGERFYPAMLEAITAARRQVLLEMYLIRSGQVTTRFIDALTAAAARGTLVCLLLDDFGARELVRADRQRLLAGGVRLAYFNPLRYSVMLRNLFRDHRKLLVVDGEIAFVGGTGIADDFAPGDDLSRYWRETMIAAEGPVVADWQALFRDNWRDAADGELPASPPPPVAGGQRGRVNYARGFFYAAIKRAAITRIRGARRRVWLATAYFVPSMKLRRVLRQAARRGADVRLLLPGAHTDHPPIRHAGRRFYQGLLRHGVRIFEYRPRFTHSKILLCDDWVSIGSSNIDRWTLRWNLEGNQEIDDVPFAAEVAKMLEQDFRDSEEFRIEDWGRRPRWQRLRETFWGWVDLGLEKWTSRPPRDDL